MLKMLTANKCLLLTRIVRVAVGVALVVVVAGVVDRMGYGGALPVEPKGMDQVNAGKPTVDALVDDILAKAKR